MYTQQVSRKLGSVLLSLILLFSLSVPVFGKQSYSIKPSPTPIPKETPAAPADSYTMFWPLVAGKTEGQSLYALKLLKENVLGLFAFNKSKKVDYQVMLGTKRVLEAEKLIKENKPDRAKKTLSRASNNFSKAYKLAKSAADRGKFNASKVRKDRLINVKILIDSLKASTSSGLSADLDKAQSSAERIMADYLP